MKVYVRSRYSNRAVTYSNTTVRAGLKGRQGRQLPRAPEKRGPQNSKPRASALETNVQEHHALITYNYTAFERDASSHASMDHLTSLM